GRPREHAFRDWGIPGHHGDLGDRARLLGRAAARGDVAPAGAGWLFHRLIRLLAGENRHPRDQAIRARLAHLLGGRSEGAGGPGPARRPGTPRRAAPGGGRAADRPRVAAVHLRLAGAEETGRVSRGCPDRPLRILLVTGSYPPMRCGVGDYTAMLAEAIGRQPGAEVAVLTSAAASAAPIGHHHRVLNVVPSWNLSGLAPAWRAAQEWSPDIVH